MPSDMKMSEKKHSYGDRMCMACGGAVCNLNYSHLRDQVEKRMMGGNAGPMAKDDAGMQYDDENDAGIAKGMMRPLGYAKGGHVKDHSKGVHTSNYEGPDNSIAGSFTKAAHKGNTSIPKGTQHQWAKDEHHRVLKEMKSMPKPHGHYADGGPVDKGLSKEALSKGQESMRQAFGHPDAKPSPKPEKKELASFADGGDIDVEMDMGDGDMLMDQCAQECMDALKSGDKSAFKSAMEAMVSELMQKMMGD